MMTPTRASAEDASQSWIDLVETPVAFAALDGTIELANGAFRSWTASAAPELGEALGIAVPAMVAALTAGKPQIIKGTAKTARGRAMPVEYQLRLAVHAGRDAIVVEGRDLSRAYEKEAMLHAFTKTIEVNNRLLTTQKVEISKLLDDVNAAYASVQRLLDAADQGFATLDRAARLLPARSAAFDRWFGGPPVGAPFAACLERLSPDVATMFELFWSQLEAELLPLDIILEMLPAELSSSGRCFRMSYRPELDAAGALVTLLVVLTDVTNEIAREHAEAEQSELSNLLARFASDHRGFVQFVAEADALAITISAPGVGQVELLRAIHTLKGNCALFGAQAIAAHCHQLEDRLVELGEAASELARRALGEAWLALRRRIGVFLEHGGDGVWIARDELDRLYHRVPELSPDDVRRALATWTWESANRRLARLGAQVRELAARLERGPVDVVVDGGGLRFDPAHWNPFWISLVHLVLNSVDHGIEPAAQRRELGKPARARVTLRARGDREQVMIEVGDDGRGIDWPAVARVAGEHGLDNSSNEALVRALFVDGLSTRPEVNSQSGRGVGLAAVRGACERLGGSIDVDSEPGQGTVFRFRFPAIGVAALHELEPTPRRSVA